MRLLSLLVVSTFLCASPGFSAGSSEGPNMADVKVMVEGGNYAKAVIALTKLAETTPTADVFNMLGFSNRKLGKLDMAAGFYDKALGIDPNHKGALEYQGEMFLMLKDVDKAKANLAKLEALCPDGCEEREDLEKAIKAM